MEKPKPKQKTVPTVVIQKKLFCCFVNKNIKLYIQFALEIDLM